MRFSDVSFGSLNFCTQCKSERPKAHGEFLVSHNKLRRRWVCQQCMISMEQRLDAEAQKIMDLLS